MWSGEGRIRRWSLVAGASLVEGVGLARAEEVRIGTVEREKIRGNPIFLKNF